MTPRYRADHVGSFLRTPELLRAREDYRRGGISLEDLRRQEDRDILDLLLMQKAANVSVFTDGEIRRELWMTGFASVMDGLGQVENTYTNGLVWHNVDGTIAAAASTERAVVAVDTLTLRKRITEDEVTFMQRHSPGPIKVTVPSPVVLGTMLWREGVTKAYKNPPELQAELTNIMRDELKWLSDRGVAYVQIDEGFTAMVSPEWRARVGAAGLNPEAVIDAAIQAENDCYAAVDRSRVTRAMHLCRGNSRSAWALTGGYDAIAERVFAQLDVDRFLLEYDSDRAGSFEPLRFIPRGKIAVLGLITTKVGTLESEDQLLARIEQAARFLPIEQLALSPQCGFASIAAGNLISVDEQRRKLELVAKVAARVWND